MNKFFLCFLFGTFSFSAIARPNNDLIIDYLKNNYHTEKAIDAISKWNLETFKKQGINKYLLDILKNPLNSKQIKLKILVLLKDKYNKPSIERATLAKALLSLRKETNSPVFARALLETVNSYAPISSPIIENMRISLLNDIFKDLLSRDTNYEYTNLDHFVCLKELAKKTPSDRTIDIFNRILSLKMVYNQLAQPIRIAIYQIIKSYSTIGIVNTEVFSSFKKKSTLNHLTKILEFKTMDLKEEVMEEDLKEELSLIIACIKNILDDPEIVDFRNEAIKVLSTLTNSDDPFLSELSGKTLISSKAMEIRNRIKGIKLMDLLKHNAEKKSKLYHINIQDKEGLNDPSIDKKLVIDLLSRKSAFEKGRKKNDNLEVNGQTNDPFKNFLDQRIRENAIVSLELINHYHDVLLSGLTIESESTLTSLYTFLNGHFLKEKELQFKSLCLQPFMELDGDIIKSKIFPIKSTQIVKKMIADCLTILKMEAKRSQPTKLEPIEKLQKQIGLFFSQISGYQYGADPIAWQNWYESDLSQRVFGQK